MITDNLSSIDWNLSVQLANNNADLAKELLQMFVNDLDQVRTTILTAFENKDYQTLRYHIHKLHGASCYCGVAKLTNLLGQLENILGTSNISEHDLNNLIQKFNNEVNNVLNDYKNIMWD